MHELDAEEKEPYSSKHSHAQQKKSNLANYCASPSKDMYALVSTGRSAGRYKSTQLALLYTLRKQKCFRRPNMQDAGAAGKWRLPFVAEPPRRMHGAGMDETKIRSTESSRNSERTSTQN
jgi:hypothetical protein